MMAFHEATCPLRQYEGREHDIPYGTYCQCNDLLKNIRSEEPVSVSLDLRVFQDFADRMRVEAMEVSKRQGMQASRVELRTLNDGWSMTLLDMRGMEITISGQYSGRRPR
jgi:hypothetical protein